LKERRCEVVCQIPNPNAPRGGGARQAEAPAAQARPGRRSRCTWSRRRTGASIPTISCWAGCVREPTEPIDRRRGGSGDDGGGRFPPGYTNPEEKLRGQCRTFRQTANAQTDTAVAAAIANVAEWGSTGADLVSGIAMFIPGGQPFGVSVRGLSLGFQAVEAGANIYVGARTGNWTGIQSQGAAFVAGGLLGAGAGRWLRATGIPGRMSPLVRSRRINAVSVAYGNALGGAASAAYCGTQ